MSLEGLHCSCSLLIWKRCLSSQAVCCLCTLVGSFLIYLLHLTLLWVFLFLIVSSFLSIFFNQWEMREFELGPLPNSIILKNSKFFSHQKKKKIWNSPVGFWN